MPDLDPTVGGATANSFASLAEADTYLDARLNASVWTSDADDDTKVRALIEATRDLSNLEELFQGYRTTSTQALPFPRRLVINRKAAWQQTIGLTGYPEYASDILPPDLVSATIELAFEYVKAGTTDLTALDSSRNVIQETVGPITTRYADPVDRAQGLARFPRVLALITPFFDASAPSGLVVERM
jgi:hypothetical protein